MVICCSVLDKSLELLGFDNRGKKGKSPLPPFTRRGNLTPTPPAPCLWRTPHPDSWAPSVRVLSEPSPPAVVIGHLCPARRFIVGGREYHVASKKRSRLIASELPPRAHPRRASNETATSISIVLLGLACQSTVVARYLTIPHNFWYKLNGGWERQ